MPLRILVVDDHGVLRAGLRARLNAEPDLQVVGEARDGNEALRLANDLKPDLILLDIGMPGMDGLDCLLALRQRWPATRVLMLSVHEDPALVRQVLRCGASGYLAKRGLESDLLEAIRKVACGELYMQPGIADRVSQAHPAHKPAANSPDALTPREVEVLSLLAKGYTNRQIADRLRLSVRTIENYRTNLTSKLQIRTRADLVRFAREHDLL